MKILYDDKISAMSITVGAQFSASYSVDNVQNDHPGKPFMANSTRASIQGTISSGVVGVFVSGLMADIATLTVNDTDNSLSYSESLNVAKYSSLKWISKNNDQQIPPQIDPFTRDTFGGTILSSPITTDTTLSDQLTGSVDTLELQANLILGNGGTEEVILAVGLGADASITNSWDGSALGAGTVTLHLESTEDQKGNQIQGNAVANWDNSGSGTTGRFEASDASAINILEHGNILLGSIVEISGTEYTIDGIVGDGTGTTDITLSGSPADGSVTSIKNPIRLGILRAGAVLSISNPQVGMTKALMDFSVRRPLVNGGYSQEQRNVSTMFNCNMLLPVADSNNFLDFYRAFRAKPFPILVLDSMADAQNEGTEYCGFVYMVDAPSATAVGGLGSYQNLYLNFSEIV